MRKKTKEIEDKELNPHPASPVDAAALNASTGKEERTIKMRSGRGWDLGTRTLHAGESVTLDAATASAIVAAGYADYV